DMFSCGGENVYPKEVENLLFGHPEVVNAVVAPVPHAVKGFVPAAMVIAREGSTVTAEDLKTYCLAKGPAYSRPRFVDIVAALPRRRNTARERPTAARWRRSSTPPMGKTAAWTRRPGDRGSGIACEPSPRPSPSQVQKPSPDAAC